ncbi:MAG: tetratricopeptide repeat protein [Spirochaetales bacterium]|nr:tetratricopeptide repeat protein [Spirochaetales bacterium]
MPKAVRYSANSIVYFKGDRNENIYILNTGAVNLKYNDIETGQEMNEIIKTGEFFGVKSALGKYPREETATVVNDSAMIVFTVPEFEAIASKNTRIIMKMLKVFSNQIRRLQFQVRNLLSKGAHNSNPETGLFRIGEYYLNVRKYPEAMYVFKRYLTYYPSGQFATQATQNIELAESRSQGLSTGAAYQPAPQSNQPYIAPQGASAVDMNDLAKEYYNAVSLFSQEKYQDALNQFSKIASGGADPEYEAKSQFEIGRCYYSLYKFDETIKHYTQLIQKYPKHPDLVDALFYVGSSYERMNQVDKAKGFYTKILSMSTDDSSVHRKAKRALQKLEGK